MRALTRITVQSETLRDEDTHLILAAQKDAAMFQAIYDRWAVPAYQYFYHRTREMAAAEDLTSQLFLSAYKAFPRYQHRGHFSAWLFTIARNLAKEHYRKSGREVSLEVVQDLVSSTNLSDEIERTDEIHCLMKLVQSLPEDEQELIRLRYVANLNFADMAMVLGKREDAVKKSLYRLQARLQNLLEQNHD